MSRKTRWPTGTAVAAALAAAAAITFVACEPAPPPEQEKAPADNAKPAPKPKVREPAVAGLFYPKEESVLSKMLDEFLETAPATSIVNLKALICPHAGYQYSGQVAAFAYRLLLGREFQTVIVLAPSHYALFEGAAVCAVVAGTCPCSRMWWTSSSFISMPVAPAANASRSCTTCAV